MNRHYTKPQLTVCAIAPGLPLALSTKDQYSPNPSYAPEVRLDDTPIDAEGRWMQGITHHPIWE